MDFIYFFIRYTPFWAMPILFISIEFGVRYQVKGKKFPARLLFFLAFFTGIANTYYFWLGGPENSVKFFINIFGHSI